MIYFIYPSRENFSVLPPLHSLEEVQVKYQSKDTCGYIAKGGEDVKISCLD